jgi:hypothetical protein
MKIQTLAAKVVTIFCVLFITSSFANSTIPVTTVLNKHDLKLVGEAQFSVMFWDIYQSRLFTKSGSFEEIDTSVIFEITYQKDITKENLIDRTVEQWQKMNVLEAKYSAYVSSLLLLWPDITSGDSLALQVADESSHFYFNDNYLGSIEGQDFAQIFLGIWLSPKTTQPKLREKLLGVINET